MKNKKTKNEVQKEFSPKEILDRYYTNISNLKILDKRTETNETDQNNDEPPFSEFLQILKIIGIIEY